jgi:hypothetical protein
MCKEEKRNHQNRRGPIRKRSKNNKTKKGFQRLIKKKKR